LQLEIEVLELFNATISKFSLAMRKVLDMISLFIYIIVEVGVWETYFLWEFKPKDGIQRNKSWKQQFGSKEVVKQVLYMYLNLFGFPFNHKLRSILNLWQIVFECVLVHIHFFGSPQSFPYSRCLG
jgi:hypothetical protein